MKPMQLKQMLRHLDSLGLDTADCRTLQMQLIGSEESRKEALLTHCLSKAINHEEAWLRHTDSDEHDLDGRRIDPVDVWRHNLFNIRVFCCPSKGSIDPGDRVRSPIITGVPLLHYFLYNVSFGVRPFKSLVSTPYPAVIILCFSVTSRSSFNEVKRYSHNWWHQLIPKFSSWSRARKYSAAPILLVGLGTQLRSDPEVVHQLYSTGDRKGPVLPEEGERLARKIHAEKYMECSSTDEDAIDVVFQEALKMNYNLHISQEIWQANFEEWFDQNCWPLTEFSSGPTHPTGTVKFLHNSSVDG